MPCEALTSGLASVFAVSLSFDGGPRFVPIFVRRPRGSVIGRLNKFDVGGVVAVRWG